MNRRERLQDQYEDALFALLMDDIATMESKKAEEENERLQNDPAAAVPEDLDRRCMQLIHHHFAKQKARTAGRFTMKAMKKIALAAGIAAILFTTAFATSEAVRVRTLNLMIEVFETNTEFRFSEAKGEDAPQLNVGWVPEEYALIEQEKDGRKVRYEFQGTENQSLIISCRKTKGVVANIDTENADVEYVPVKNTQAMLVHKENTLQLVWSAKDNSIFISILGTELTQEDIIHIANELQY